MIQKLYKIPPGAPKLNKKILFLGDALLPSEVHLQLTP